MSIAEYIKQNVDGCRAAIRETQSRMKDGNGGDHPHDALKELLAEQELRLTSLKGLEDDEKLWTSLRDHCNEVMKLVAQLPAATRPDTVDTSWVEEIIVGLSEHSYCLHLAIGEIDPGTSRVKP